MSGTIFNLEATHLDLLRQEWNELASHYTGAQEEADRAFNLLARLYSEEGRVYHNLSHVRALLGLSGSIKELIKDQNAVAFAIWFHDAVYNTRKTDNEEQSAELAAGELSQLGVPPETISRVQTMILATKHHAAVAGSRDSELFLDLDLSILGASPEVYRNYSRAIRREYRWVPGFLYRRKRREILEGFVWRASLYFTEEMAIRFESQARQNIEDEIKELSK